MYNKSKLKLIKRNRYAKIYLTLIVLCIGIILIMQLKNPKFVSIRNFMSMGHQMSMTAIISFAVTPVIICRTTDLSTGANLALCSMVGVIAYQSGLSVFLCVILMLFTGIAVGVMNGLLISYMKISPFLATFAMMQFVRGTTVFISHSSSKVIENKVLLWLGEATLGPIPISVLLTCLLCALWWFLMNKTVYGRHVYAVGGNFDTARASCINSKLVQFSTLLIAGLSVGISSLLYLGRVQSAQPNAGLGLEFDVLTAVFIGGALVSGGAGRVTGALLGTFLVTVIKTALSFWGIPQFVSYIVVGVFIMLSVMIYESHIITDSKKFFHQICNVIKYKHKQRKGSNLEKVEATENHTIELNGISKSFSGFLALNDISTRISSGEIVGLIGENGAGKSTLVNILSGVYQPSQGYIALDGKKIRFGSPQDSKDSGIGVVHQHYSLIPELDIAQNLFYNQEPLFFGIVRRKTMKRKAKQLLEEFNLDIPVEKKVYQLTTGQCQMIEILKAVQSNPWLLIMDEPTSSLSRIESEHLYKLIDQVLTRNVAVIYISHKIAEIFKICKRTLVLRDGHLVNEVSNLTDISEKQLVDMMVGRKIEQVFPYTKAELGETALEVEHLSDGGLLKDVSFYVRRGETVVLAGLMGAGKTETVECIYGLRHIAKGNIKINGITVKPNAKKMLENNIGFVPEDRLASGIVLQMSVSDNLTLIWNHKYAKHGIINLKDEKKIVKKVIEQTDIKPPEPNKEAIFLSGGNQQKVVVGKWVAIEPDIFIMDDPTRGIDVGAKSEIHEIISEFKKSGSAILMISSELPEALNVADRIYVMRNGCTVKELGHETTESEIMNYAFGTHE